jgi:hypothetical protein
MILKNKESQIESLEKVLQSNQDIEKKIAEKLLESEKQISIQYQFV